MGFDLFEIFRALVKESVSFKSYKRLHPALAVLCFIILSPFIAVYAGLLIVYLVLATIFKFVHSAFDYLYAFVHGEGQVVKHIAQAVIYLIGFPLLFALKVIYSVLTYPLVFMHFVVTHVGYIATFGGIKYSPFMFENADRTKQFPKHCLAAVIVFVIIGMILFTLAVAFEPVTIEVYEYNKEQVIMTAVVDTMQQSVKDGKIEANVYNEQFIKDYNAGKINADNYMEYLVKYLGDDAKPLWNVQEEVVFLTWVYYINVLVNAAYVAFTVLYVSIYSSVIKRRRTAVA